MPHPGLPIPVLTRLPPFLSRPPSTIIHRDVRRGFSRPVPLGWAGRKEEAAGVRRGRLLLERAGRPQRLSYTKLRGSSLLPFALVFPTHLSSFAPLPHQDRQP
ncbi:hypothetical protein Nmel_007786, partial [Mimus melanotis]